GDSWRVVASAGGGSAGRMPNGEESRMAARALADGSVQGVGGIGLAEARPRRLVVPGGRTAAYAGAPPVGMGPLKIDQRSMGVMPLDGPIGASPFRHQPQRLLTAVASEAAAALQRSELASAAAHAEALRQADEMKTALMASISHDLKTPLAGIKAAISSIL